MSYAKQMTETYPRSFNVDTDTLVSCIEACYDCAQACTACADACLSEDNVAELVKCIRTDLDCSDVCQTTGRVLSRQTEYDADLTRCVLQACKSCGEECASHAEMGMDHCRVCAEACRACEEACNKLLEAMQA